MEHAIRSEHGSTRPTTRAGGGTYTTTSSVLTGRAVLDELGAEFDELAQAAGAPVTARAVWLRAWVGAYRPAGAWAVTVRDRSSGRLDGVGVLSSRWDGDHEAISPLGRRQSDRGALPARHPDAAVALAAAVARALRARSGAWVLRLGQLPAGDPVAACVTTMLDAARVVPGVPIPKVEFGDAPGIDPWLGKGLRKQLRKARNRLASDGLTLDTAFTRAPADVAVLLDEIERTHRARERDARRTSDLESTPGLCFWRRAIVDHARRGEVEVATLRLGGELAAYVVSLVDGDAYRVFDGRFATAWSRYSPGRLLEIAALERAFDDGRFARVDWMNGCASEKLVAANAVDPTEHLVAWSPGLAVDLDVIGRPPAAAEPDAAVRTLPSSAR